MLHKCLHHLGLALCIHLLMWRFYPPTIGARSTFFDVPVRRGQAHWLDPNPLVDAVTHASVL